MPGTVQNALLEWTHLTFTSYDSIFQIRLTLRQLAPRSCSQGWVKARRTSGVHHDGCWDEWVEHMTTLEELVSQKCQMRVCLLWVHSILQNLVNILAYSLVSKRVWSNCCFCAGLCLGECCLGWECRASQQKQANVRQMPKEDRTHTICMKTVDQFSQMPAPLHVEERTTGYTFWEVNPLEVFVKLMIVYLGYFCCCSRLSI